MLGGIDWKMFLSPEMRTTADVLSGEKSIDEAALNYGMNYAGGELMSSMGGTDALGNSQEKLFNEAGQEQLLNDAIPNPLDTQAITPKVPTIQNSGLQDSGIVGQGGQVKLGDNALNSAIPQQGIDITNSQPSGVQLNDNAYQNINTPSGATNPLPDVQFDGYNDSGLPPVDIPKEAPGTFLGLEGKDYTKLGMQGVMAAGASAAQTTPIQPSKAPVGPGMTRGNPIPQGGAVGVNSMVNPVQPLNSMQMTQAQGLISPFQRDRMRRGQY